MQPPHNQGPWGPPGPGAPNPYPPQQPYPHPQGYDPQGYAPPAPAPAQSQVQRSSSGIAVLALLLAILGCFGFPIINLLVFVLVLGRETSGSALMIGIGLGALTVFTGFVLAIVALARSKNGETGGRVAAVLAIVFSGLSLVTAAAATFVGIIFAGGGGAHGRPLRVFGRVREAPVEPGDGWSTGGSAPDVASVDEATRARLAQAWLADASMEHASVAAFARLSLDLMALGAPAVLLEGAQRAGMEEVSHARDCFALASAYAGRTLAPGALTEAAAPLGDEGAAARLCRVAVESAVDGCVGEGVAAMLAREAAGDARDPAVASVLARIAAEEQRHADLSAEVLSWCLQRGGAAVERAVRNALQRAAVTVAGHAEGATYALREHGRVDPARWAPARARASRALLERLNTTASNAPSALVAGPAN